MDTQYRLSRLPSHAQVQMLEKRGPSPLSFLAAPRTVKPRPLSEATEIIDTDFEGESSERHSSSRKSVESFGNDSSTTLSTADELPTPGPFDEAPLSLHWDDRKPVPVEGPSGPHLFRTSFESSSTGKVDELEWTFPTSPVNLEDIRGRRILTGEPEQRAASDVIVRSSSRTSTKLPQFPRQDESAVRAWTPTQVADWMYEYGVEDVIVERFIENDISGSVLLDLQIDDLKELDIQSFGKRHRLMCMIQGLSQSLVSSEEPIIPSTRLSKVHRSNSTRQPRSKEGSRSPGCDEPLTPISPARRGRRHRGNKDRDMISPAESVSIVAIEQLLPKPHKCSKGENCPKYQRRQRKIARIAQEFPNEFIQVTGDRVTTTFTEASVAETANRPKSEAQPSEVASSDVLGPEQHGMLNAQNLNEVQPRDPQENVRQFLNFQHLSIMPVQNQDGPLEMFPPLSPPDNSSPTAHIAANLRSLPKLTIPETNAAADLLSRTITPSLGSRQVGSATATQEYNPYLYPEVYRQTTPFSEMDIPVTAIPADPLARETSQSVPPHLTYGHPVQSQFDPIYRPQSARPEHRKRPSFTTNMAPVHEGKPFRPIDDPADMVSGHVTSSSQSSSQCTVVQPSSRASSQDSSVSHSGYMKKRRTTRLLRHEWQEAHFTLNGTLLAMHKDEQDARRNSRALETIDVDDYAVACSSLASSSKLTAAFKRSLLRKAALTSSGCVKGLDETAFAFSLIPATEKAEKKLFNPSGKSHHFAVKSRDERINWMRELMLAKALRKGKEGGEEMRINGSNVI